MGEARGSKIIDKCITTHLSGAGEATTDIFDGKQRTLAIREGTAWQTLATEKPVCLISSLLASNNDCTEDQQTVYPTNTITN